jgi:hypothetical protein
MRTWEIKTQAATRSKARRDMTHTVEAETEDDAVYEARKRHIDRVGWNASVWVTEVTEVQRQEMNVRSSRIASGYAIVLVPPGARSEQMPCTITIEVHRLPLRRRLAWYLQQLRLYAVRPFTRPMTADEWYAADCPPFAGQSRPW